MKKITTYKKKVIKPWGFEYEIFRNDNKLAITYVNIMQNKQTSLHCHPSKKTGFIILQGRAKVQIGIYKSNYKIYKPLSILVLRAGLFHSLKCVSKNPLIALEFETPANKKDLVRFKDLYGRESKPYENNSSMQLDKSLVFFKKPNKKNCEKYNFNNFDITIKNFKSYKAMFKNKKKSVSAILDGKIVDKQCKQVISYGEIIKTQTLKILSKKFNIHKKILVMQISKKNNSNFKKNGITQLN